jgi:carbon storage regulator CsrA
LIKITVLEIGIGKVKLGFEADGDIPVHRMEVWERISTCSEPSGFDTESAAPQSS